jgi:hypothetical protein
MEPDVADDFQQWYRRHHGRGRAGRGAGARSRSPCRGRGGGGPPRDLRGFQEIVEPRGQPGGHRRDVRPRAGGSARRGAALRASPRPSPPVRPWPSRTCRRC